jgi:predicted RNA binding protein YcfA (HicA-like mRNA interferase family)
MVYILMPVPHALQHKLSARDHVQGITNLKLFLSLFTIYYQAARGASKNAYLDTITPVAWREVLKALSKAGFQPVRQHGNHILLESPEGEAIVVPRYEEIRRGTLLAVIQEAGLRRDEFLNLKQGNPTLLLTGHLETYTGDTPQPQKLIHLYPEQRVL